LQPRVLTPFLLYHQINMRRGLSIILVLFFGLGPLAATLSADDESRLPLCCRRHGAHHCAMSDAMMARRIQAAYGSTPIVTAPTYCPAYHGNAATSIAPVHGMASSVCQSPFVGWQAYSPFAAGATALSSHIRIRSVRGPPIPNLI